ncbi:hypothetical protein ACFQXB_11375 [Plastorhodobacter daqingensis]|uniref:Uncharacterized protein n=1 Tax=Plastorhodobacter daqingensis TaxID=1387281 RepID=A0ABW2UL58_9RHOB
MTIYETAIRNFEAAADILTTLQASRVNMLSQALDSMIGRPKAVLSEGYNDIGLSFGLCLPAGKRGDLLKGSEEDTSVEIRTSGISWMTLEGVVPANTVAGQVYLEIEAQGESTVVADVFIREIRAGAAVDGPLHEWRISPDGVSVFKLALPESDEPGAVSRRVIVHLRQPPRRLVLRRFAMTLF